MIDDGPEKQLTVIVADDDQAIRTVLGQAMEQQGYRVVLVADIDELLACLGQGEGDLLICDVVMPGREIFDVLPEIRAQRPELPVIIMSAQSTALTAIRAMQEGAAEYLPKPFDLNEMLALARRFEGSAIAGSAEKAKDKPKDVAAEGPLIGHSTAMQEVFRLIARMTRSDLTVFITGESGTGKELVARALHNFSQRSSASFVAVNMAAIPRELIESELFGHEKGAFTGAHSASSGLFAQAEGGTLFLDEIGDMPMEAQTRLLRVLQQGEYVPVGGRTAIVADVRIVAATNRDPMELVRDGLFREDLYYRLNVVPIRLPPLRERVEDIPDLVQHFLRKAASNGQGIKSISADAVDLLKTFRWPGNIRELENMVYRLVALHSRDELDLAAVGDEIANMSPPVAELARAVSGPLGMAGVVRSFVEEILAKQRTDLTNIHEQVMLEVEVPMIETCLKATSGNQLRAAQLLGLNRNTLRSKIRNYGIRLHDVIED